MTEERAIKELIYEPGGDTLQIWLVGGPVQDTYNKPLDDDGLYVIVRLGKPSETVGWEIVGFQHYASVHTEWRPLANRFKGLPGGSVIWNEPAPGAGLQRLIHA
jgi:hypothetical protein